MENTKLSKAFLSFHYTSDVKSLPGFVKGGRDKVPKEISEYQSKLISGWADQTIKEHVEAVATKAKIGLDISARDFQTPYYETGSGGFDCKLFNYNFSVTQSEEIPSSCVFTGVLEIQDIEIFDEVQTAIDNCFEYEFDKATSSFPKSDFDLKELIYSVDDNKKALSDTFEFSYENDFSSFQLVHKQNGTIITADNLGIDINFQESSSIYEKLSALKKVNEKIFFDKGRKDLLTV